VNPGFSGDQQRVRQILKSNLIGAVILTTPLIGKPFEMALALLRPAREGA
jgi:hypothetical protein